jgi:hypothetical protein
MKATGQHAQPQDCTDRATPPLARQLQAKSALMAEILSTVGAAAV